MASTNEEMPPQNKPRISPLEYRNTDLVSRLLAATPPYLYNMSMVPNTYFFSEMLRSFVQAKAERTSAPLARRSRKRSWTQTKSSNAESSQSQTHPKQPKLPIEDTWKPVEGSYYDEHKLPMPTEHLPTSNKDKYPVPGMFPHPTSASSVQAQPQATADSSSSLILPPPPPIWYPPLYNTPPYGIDPLHFFIDLRVSGHIYDRKKTAALEKDDPDLLSSLNSLSTSTSTMKDLPMGKAGNSFKSSKHASAFSVPMKNHPINLSKAEDVEHKPLKFDVKSLGLESTHNKTGINYVMNNIERVYKDLHDYTNEGIEGAEERKKRELKDLIGLELAVDYMSQNNKMGIKNVAEQVDADGVVLDVVDVQDET